ncbi:MAG: type II toxin-antitoxin system VapC family toxin [Deltaproteobacteria bacterium]
MDWVLDASIALAWALPDEASDQADRFLSRVTAKDVLWVPSLWWYEVANALVVAERRKRLTEADGICRTDHPNPYLRREVCLTAVTRNLFLKIEA